MTSAKNLDLLIKLHKRNVRIITYSPYRTSTTPLFYKPNYLKIKKICELKLKVSKSMYKLHNHKIEYCNSLKQVTEIQKYNTRYSSHFNYFIHRKRTNIGKKLFSFVGPKIWQDVPSNLKSCSFQVFKKNLKL